MASWASRSERSQLTPLKRVHCASHRAHDWRVEGVICDTRSNIAFTAGAFADAARLAERAAGLARGGGDLADASLQLGIAAAGYLLVGDAPSAVPLAGEALTLARQIGDPALIASGLLAVGTDRIPPQRPHRQRSNSAAVAAAPSNRAVTAS
jgi:hypothetical protein